jgi:Flp pilus assembly protein TadD
MCEHVLHFLGATLKQETAPREALERSVRGEGLDDGFRLRSKPADKVRPTPRQLAQYSRQHGAEKAVELMRSFGDETGVAASAATDVLLKDGDAKAALALLALVEKKNSKEVWFQVRLGQARTLTGDRAGARAAYRKAAELLPAVEKTRGPQPVSKFLIEQGLKELGQSEPPPKDR